MAAETADAPRASLDSRVALSLALRLAFGSARPNDAEADWSGVFDAAATELLAPLAWTRSGAFIRRHASAPVSAGWRRTAMAAHLRGERQLQLLTDATSALHEAGVNAVTLKGLTLGERLYGAAFVRCSADIDLYVPAAERVRAARVLTELGWRSDDGEPPWHESWSRVDSCMQYHLELHSSLVCDHLSHVRAPTPSSEIRLVAGTPVRCHAGEFVAPYLAVHLATHQLAPLLWMVDFATLWRSLSAFERECAERAARDAGLARYLSWACERAGLVERASLDDLEALRALGIYEHGRRDMHSIWRHIALAAGVGDRVRVIAAFVLPHRVRGKLGSVARYTIARLRTRLRAVAGASRLYGRAVSSGDRTNANTPPNALRPLRLERDAMVPFTRDVVGAGGALWVRAPGGSMIPTIPRGALVRIGPIPSSGMVVGDIVLGLTSAGEPVLHRAISVRNDGVIMRGDAAIVEDPFVPWSGVIGVATHVRHDEVERALSRRSRRSLAVSALKMRRRIARVLRRAD